MSTVSIQEFEEFLDDISVAFIERKFELWERRVILPFSLVTKDGPVVLRTRNELRNNYEQYLLASDAMRLDKVYRTVIGLENCQDGTWLGTYKTHLLSSNIHATDPYISTALLKPMATGLRMHSVLNARGHHDWVGEHPLAAVYAKLGTTRPD